MAGYEDATSDNSRYLPMNSSIRRGTRGSGLRNTRGHDDPMYKNTAFQHSSRMTKPVSVNKETETK